jgi:spore maturation protein CgeB
MTRTPPKILLLDGIGGVPLGRELCEALSAEGVETVYFDCLQRTRRPLYTVRSAYAKLRNKGDNGDSFYCLPRLLESELQEAIQKVRPDAILVVGFAYRFYSPDRLRSLADAAGAGLYLYDTDSCNLYSRRREFIFFIENELPVYDRVFSFSQVTTRFFRETLGLDAYHLPFGAAPIKLPQSEQTIEALFIGSCDLRRIFLLETIREQVTIFGSRWRRNWPLISAGLRSRVTDSPVWGSELHRLFADSKVVLNITRSNFFGVETGINLRIFEALAAGKFLLTDRCAEVEALFQPGVEIETFGSSAELSEKLHFYLTNDTAREAIAQRGHEALQALHTWQQRASALLAHIQQSPATPPGPEQ